MVILGYVAVAVRDCCMLCGVSYVVYCTVHEVERKVGCIYIIHTGKWAVDILHTNEEICTHTCNHIER